jgi:hypothetical protein
MSAWGRFEEEMESGGPGWFFCGRQSIRIRHTLIATGASENIAGRA